MKKLCLCLVVLLGLTGCLKNDEEYYSVFVETEDRNKGSVYGNATYESDSSAVIVAIPADGYVFKEWNDGDKNAVRKVHPSENTTYTAYFEKNKEYFALDKVEVYVEKTGTTIKAKSVEYHGLKIYNDNEIISDGASSNRIGATVGSKLVHSFSVSGGSVATNIVAKESSPFSFYSARNEHNIFGYGTTFNLSIDFDYSCHSGYINGDKYVYDNNFAGHGGSSQTLSFEITEETTEIVTLVDDSNNHGYKIYAKLHFVKI